jgi:hypothetical protein
MTDRAISDQTEPFAGESLTLRRFAPTQLSLEG